MDEHDYAFIVGIFALIILACLFVSKVIAPCHGSVFSPRQEGCYCRECGEPIYHVCECGHKLQFNYCTYCGAENEFMEE